MERARAEGKRIGRAPIAEATKRKIRSLKKRHKALSLSAPSPPRSGSRWGQW
jgi:hypothetical protein